MGIIWGLGTRILTLGLVLGDNLGAILLQLIQCPA